MISPITSKKYHKVFGLIYVSVVRSGLRSCKIDEAADKILSYLEQMDAFSRKVRTALRYPIFMLGDYSRPVGMQLRHRTPRLKRCA